MAERMVRGQLSPADVSELNEQRVQFQIDEVTTAPDGVRYPSSVDAVTDVAGEFSVLLKTQQDYTVTFPEGDKKKVFVPDGEGEARLEDCIVDAYSAQDRQYAALRNYVASIAPNIIKPTLDEAAAMVTQGAAGTSLVTFERAPQPADGNDGDTYLNAATGDIYRKVLGSWGNPLGNLAGPQGAAGPPGPTGPQGEAGAGNYTHIAYAEDAEGGGADYVPHTGTAFIALEVTDSETPPPLEAFSAWLPMQGPQGAQGVAGENGQSAHVFIRYAENAEGAGMSSAPQSTSTHIAVLSKDTPTPPAASELSGLWVPYIRDTAGGDPGPLPPLHIKLSEVAGPSYDVSLQAGRELIIERDAAKTLTFTDLTDGGRGLLTLIAPREGTIYPVTTSPALTLELTDRPGYADTYLLRSYQGRVYTLPSLLNFAYDPLVQYWAAGVNVCYLFEAANNPLKNRIADINHITMNQGTVRAPYGLELTPAPKFAMSADFSGLSFTGAWWAHFVLANLAEMQDGGSFGGFTGASPDDYIRLSLSYGASAKYLKMTVRNGTNANGFIGDGSADAALELPSDLTGLTSVIVSYDGAGRYNMRCTNTGAVAVASTENAAGYYPSGQSTAVTNYGPLAASFGGIWRRANTTGLNGAPTHVRYFAMRGAAYTAADAQDSHNAAASWFADIEPTGLQLARL